MNWIFDNKAWLFDGAAVVIPLAIIGWIFNKSNSKQVQKSGDDSNNIQIGGNVVVNSKNVDD